MEISFDISSGVLLEVHPCFPSEIPLEISLRISVRNYSKLPWMEFFSKFSWNLFIYPSNSSGVSSKNSLGNFFRIRMFLQGFLQKLHTNNWRFLERIHEKFFINTWKIVWSNPLKTLLVIPLKIPRKKKSNIFMRDSRTKTPESISKVISAKNPGWMPGRIPEETSWGAS